MLDALQETSRALYERNPWLISTGYAIVVAVLGVFFYQFLFLMPSRRAAPTAANFEGRDLLPVQVNVYVGQAPVAPLPTTPPLPPSESAFVENGGFEEGTSGWGSGFFESLVGSQGGAAIAFNGAVAQWYVDEQRPRGGRKALRVEQSSTAAPHVYSTFSQRIKVKSHRRYEVRFWAYLEATDGRGDFSLRVLPSRKTALPEWDRLKRKADPSVIGRWQEVRVDFESGDDVSFDLRFFAETAMKVWVDDVSVTGS